MGPIARQTHRPVARVRIRRPPGRKPRRPLIALAGQALASTEDRLVAGSGKRLAGAGLDTLAPWPHDDRQRHWEGEPDIDIGTGGDYIKQADDWH